MSTKPSDDMFNLAALPQHELKMNTMPSYNNLPITRAEKRSAIEARKQLQVIDQERRKTIAAQQAVAEIQHSGFTTFVETAEQMYDLRCANNRPRMLQEYIDTYFDRCVKKTGAYLEMVSDRGVGAIAVTVARSTYVDRIEQQPGLFARLAGRTDEY